MKISVWWLLAIPVLIAGIAKSEGAHGVFWEYEMKRPEAQLAIKQYVEQKCSFSLWTRDLENAQANSTPSTSAPADVRAYCRADEHQK